MGFFRAITIVTGAQNSKVVGVITPVLTPRNYVIDLKLIPTSAAVPAGTNVFALMLGSRKNLSSNFKWYCLSFYSRLIDSDDSELLTAAELLRSEVE